MNRGNWAQRRITLDALALLARTPADGPNTTPTGLPQAREAKSLGEQSSNPQDQPHGTINV